MKINAIDLFCGVGGLTNGIQKTGINVIAGFDIAKECQYAFEYNNDAKFIYKDVRNIEDDEILNLYPKDTDIKILMGCAPCQPFSAYSHRYKDSENRKEKMELLDYFGKQVKLVQPDVVSMENVPQLANEPVFINFIELLKLEGYYIDWKIIYAPSYGIPQNRKRLLLLASKLGEINLIPETYDENNYPTVRQAIGNLPKISAGETFVEDPLHRSRNLTDINLKRIRSSKPGGTWKDWEEDLLPNCYRKKSGSTYGSVYGRLEWDKPSSTITTQFLGYGNGRFGHPEQDRALSLREGAILQSFPSNYQFFKTGDTYSTQQLAMQIGNAVPPKLGEVIGISIRRHLGLD
ncbi:DNA (cytosine-5-)-methyltransferase [Enterococcus mundtii]|uniref:DNA cytosine methyltransferase n=1 Tax=Enterococcus mundtii TaxID=53346 RepID=UPI00101FDE55|nr:DNA cytosine methyltransferase [Enterococcus mundtii]MZU11608.1 DNA (cytosine-5-)-methyltransferase [Bifidobacterium longum]MZZ58581.1 DNA (cytosine-5-)-methyltransferase [Enterococcus mundtii]MZZ62366.1 DNA (cytosine-5-)-methyltransferase [Enterococcus mundtii]MZZ68541.1 DNA (cytosine-5-)-methyltransferase [Enterococcus mundtii]MZZ97212.1 DNA (cytosine-5-)-methyltransferase [Enterococcus mundtii]